MEMETGSKKVGLGDCDSELDPRNSAIDLLPPEMLQSIYNFLPFKDLLSCREVSKKWKSVATDPVRKRCAPFDFCRDDIPTNQRSRALQSFTQLIRATNEQGDLGEFPVTEFKLILNSDFYWIEMDGSTLICTLLEAVSPFVKHISFNLDDNCLQVPSNCPAASQDLAFPNLKEITLRVIEHQDEDCVFSFVRKIVENCSNIKEIHLHLKLYDKTQSSEVRRCIVDTGIEQKARLVTSLILNEPRNESDYEYLTNIGFKLKYFSLNLVQLNGNTEFFKKFMESQSDTLTSLKFCYGSSYQHLRELPCLPHLKNLKISSLAKKGEEQFSTLFYKELLPTLRKIDLTYGEIAADYIMASHIAPSESLRELILPQGGVEDAGGLLRQAACLFPNLKKLQVYHESAGHYMTHIYEALPGIEELCISTEGRKSVDDIITGLPGMVLHKIRKEVPVPPSYHLSKGFAMLERGTTKTLACLENLKILMIYRRDDFCLDIVKGADFTELSGVVLKQMKGLQRIDFGVRKYGPIISADLKEDLETQGIKLFYRRRRYIRSRTDFIASLTESDDPGSGPDDWGSFSDSDY